MEILDGGMLYELNKLYSDLGQEALLCHPHIIESIYQKYIDIGCHYITTCNYGFKSLKLDNWEDLVVRSVDLTFQLKNKNYSKNIKLLGCLPPYYESYHQGPVNKEFHKFYETLVSIMDAKVDFYIMETQVNIEHIMAIMEQIRKQNSKKKIYISIYPNGQIIKKELETLIEEYPDMIAGILVNCCSFGEVVQYFLYHLRDLDLVNANIKFGFYFNKIDEKSYAKYSGEKIKSFNLLDYTYVDIVKSVELYNFIKYLEREKYKIIIGGCCGYGIEEMKQLISMIHCYQVLQTARL